MMHAGGGKAYEAFSPTGGNGHEASSRLGGNTSEAFASCPRRLLPIPKSEERWAEAPDPIRSENHIKAKNDCNGRRRVQLLFGNLHFIPFHFLGGSFSAVSTPIFQVNTRWKALAEIYTMHSFAPFSYLNFFVKNRHFFCD